ncbi:hypothetical protein FYJ53_05880 [Eubacterium sp. BL-380-WT-2B]|uniref:hypothetical protein n=1 Tax=Eubacterium TaxID=1730 RepID=UPI0012B321B5|nr:hypothetical protein [Eubacterium sp. BL-380-WT-2B]MSS93292.1 hypothetical protein [Eubacterium sp. BL-380-WT-2B]
MSNEEFSTYKYGFFLIASVEWDRIMEELDGGEDITKGSYAEYLEFEYEYSHNEIDEEQEKLIRALNDYFEFKKLPYHAEIWIDEVRIKEVEKWKKS